MNSVSVNVLASGQNEVADPPYTAEELRNWGLDPARLPRHVAIIMDGNGRWAQARGLPRIEGHRRGVSSVRRIVEECSRLGLEQLTLYCFSSENWKRPEAEQRLLMQLLVQYLVEERAEILRQRLRFCVIGRREQLGEDVLREIDRTTQLTVAHGGMRLCLAINYGSRAEILDAVKRLTRKVLAEQMTVDALTEEDLAGELDTAGMPDPDLLIRTANEMRISNFLLWQISYSEFWVTDRFWPEFSVEDLRTALRNFAGRNRRFGGLQSNGADTSANAQETDTSTAFDCR